MNMMQAVKQALGKKYSDVKGRVTRSEYWWFILFLILGDIVTNVLDVALGWQFGEPDVFGSQMGTLNILFNLAVLVPCICVTARRLHDVNRSGWWMLIPLTIIGIIPFYYWMLKKSDAEQNKWGHSPAMVQA